MRSGLSRKQLQQLRLDEARSIAVPAQCDVCVIGSGPAGIVAGICAAEAGATTVVLDAAETCMTTVLATGNGRCNFSNQDLSSVYYRNPEFFKQVAGAHPLDAILSFFRDCGLMWTAEDDRLYPRSMQAASVRELVLSRAKRAGVILAPARQVTHITWQAPNKRWGIAMSSPWDSEAKTPASIEARSCILATGGTSSHPFTITPELPAPIFAFTPVLCALESPSPLLRTLDGRRARCKAKLMRNGQEIYGEAGEVLFRSYGLSGIVVFNLSRYTQAGDVVELDLAHDLSEAELVTYLAERMSQPLATTLSALVDPVIARALADALAEHASSPQHISHFIKHLSFPVAGPAQTEHAQVMRGGIDTFLLDPTSMALVCAEHLYACGEAVDIDGACGGYNLSWAWLSGMVAGAAAARAIAGATRDAAAHSN